MLLADQLDVIAFDTTLPINPESMTALMAKTIRTSNAALPPDVPALPVARLHDPRQVHAAHLLLAGVPDASPAAARNGGADPRTPALLVRPLASPDLEPEDPRSLSL